MTRTWRRILTVGAFIIGIAIVGLLAFNTYVILTGDESGSSRQPEPARSAPVAPEAQATPTCGPQEVYMARLGGCVHVALSCAPTERYDFFRERCVPDIPELEEPDIPEPAVPSFGERRCQEAQADLSDALAELAVKQTKLSECQSPDPPAFGCMFIESDVDSALWRLESARSSVSIWCP